MLHVRAVALLAGFLALSGCWYSTDCGTVPERPVGETLHISDAPLVRFAVIGDYGRAGDGERAVAELVKGWEPDFIITTGDNNYKHGSSRTIDKNVGQYYHAYIHPYKGSYGMGADTNRFFPTIGNHDWNPRPYQEYYTLPGNERYYDFTWGPVHFFALDSVECEPHGTHADSRQAAWLKERLAFSDKPFRCVYAHHPPYSSASRHGSTARMQWPYKEWGADLFFAGHDHTYERIERDGMLYFVNGLGGRNTHRFREAVEGSAFRYNATFGAMLVEVTSSEAVISFHSVDGTLVDRVVLTK